MKNILFSIILLSIILPSCKISKKIENSKTERTDTTINTVSNTVIVYKDTIIKVPGDTLKIQIPCDQDSVFTYEHYNLRGLVTVKNRMITVTQICDEKDIIITKIRQELKEEKSKNTELVSRVDQTVVLEKKYIPKFYIYCTIGFFLFVAYFAGKFALKKI